MKYSEARQIVLERLAASRRFIDIALDSPVGTPLHNEMKQAAIEATSWIHDDEIVEALYEADRKEFGDDPNLF